MDFARPGQSATRRVALDAGSEALSMFPFSMEAQLRGLGMPTLLKNGVIQLMGDYTVCEKDQPLDVNQTQILKLLGEKMTRFEMELVAVWKKSDGSLTSFVEEKGDVA